MFTNTELTTFKDNSESILKNLRNYENLFLDPTLAELKRIEEIIFSYIKQYKRKIYGGYATHKHIIAKNPEDKLYDTDNTFADIDFYSPEPIEDAMRLANIFKEKGFQNASATEAAHKETYTIHVDFEKVCDISWVPKNIYNRIPFTEYDGMYYAAPDFVLIDLLRMVTDPLTSGSQRWEKIVPRLFMLQKYYPYHITKSLSKSISMRKYMEHVFNKNADNNDNLVKFKYYLTQEDETTIKGILKNIEKMMVKNKNFILHGDYAYNYYLEESKMEGTPLNIITFDAICADYVDKTRELRDSIKQLVGDNATHITTVEYYPFWMLTGYSCSICYKGYPLITVSAHGSKCVPVKVTKDDIVISSYDYTVLLAMVDSFRGRVNKDSVLMGYKSEIVSDLVKFKNKFFTDNPKKTMLDETPFQRFIIQCTGKTVKFNRAAQIERKARADKKQVIVWKYHPGKSSEENIYKFANTSGNLIRNNLKNLKISENLSQ